MPDNSIKIVMEAADKTQAAFDSLQKNLSLIKWDAIVNLGQKALQAGRELSDFLNIGAKAAQTGDAFRAIAAASGVMGDKLIENMKSASGVFVDDTELMILAQRALVENLDPDQIVKLMESARVAARLMGTDVKASFDLIMESVISMRTRGLRAAFPMEEEAVFEKYAKSVGAMKEDLSEWGKRQALVNEILRQTGERLEAIGPLAQTLTEKIQQAGSAWQNFIETVSKAAGEGGQVISKFGIDMAKGLKDEFENGLEEIKGMFFKTTDELLAYSKKMAEQIKKPSALKEVTPPEPGWAKKWVEQFDALQYSFDQLGITSEKTLTEQAVKANVYAKQVEKAFLEGKASVVDFKNALLAAGAAMEKLIPKDVTKSLVDLMEQTDKEIAKISKDDPDRLKKIQEINDRWAENKKRILEANQTITELTKNVGNLLAKLPEVKLKLDAETAIKGVEQVGKGIDELRRKASEPIRINVETNTSGSGAGGVFAGLDDFGMGKYMGGEGGGLDDFGMGKYMQGASANLESTVKFYGEASPRKPLSETIQDLLAQFGALGDSANVMNTVIDFSDMAFEMSKIGSQLVKIRDILPSINRAIWRAGGWGSGPTDPQLIASIQEAESELTHQMSMMQMKMTASMMELGMGDLNNMAGLVQMIQGLFGSSSWSRFSPGAFGGIGFSPTPINWGSYPSFGTGGMVPETGLYQLHRGEEVRTTNQVSNDNRQTNNITIITNDPKRMADEIRKLLKYKRTHLD